MRRFFLLFVFLLLLPLPLYAENSCIEARTTKTKIADKIVDVFDISMPILLHDPQLSIDFHLTRAKNYYRSAQKILDANPTRAMRLAAKGQNHLTLLEMDIRSLQQGQVAYDTIFNTLKEISSIQTTLELRTPQLCSQSLQTLKSFQKRTEENIKKLYYESLLP